MGRVFNLGKFFPRPKACRQSCTFDIKKYSVSDLDLAGKKSELNPVLVVKTALESAKVR